MKPNVRKLFIPDPNYIIVDADLSGADAQIVAWEANDEILKDSLRKGIKLHAVNAASFWGDKYTNSSGETGNKQTPKGKLYDEIKRAVHATNYGAHDKTLELNLNWPKGEGQRFRSWWFKEHPGIKDWQDRTEYQLRTFRKVSNKFGYSITYFDRVDKLLPEALAWVPQSTVAIASFMGAIKVKEQFPWVEFLLQVHDSLVFQIPKQRIGELEAIKNALTITIPYSDPLTIQSKVAISAKSWGDVEEIKDWTKINLAA